MSWRPEDKEAWEKDRYETCSRILEVDTYKVYEAGADAMLEAVKEHVVNVGKEVGRDDLEFRVRIAAWLCG